MFEKEAEEYFRENAYNFDEVTACRECMEFGYNKANEWHYVKDKLPPSGETVLFYFGTDIMGKAVTCTGCVDCRGEWYKSLDAEPIMWQEIVLPKESE